MLVAAGEDEPFDPLLLSPTRVRIEAVIADLPTDPGTLDRLMRFAQGVVDEQAYMKAKAAAKAQRDRPPEPERRRPRLSRPWWRRLP